MNVVIVLTIVVVVVVVVAVDNKVNSSKRYSSWSLIGRLGVKYCFQSNEAVDEVMCRLAGADSN